MAKLSSEDLRDFRKKVSTLKKQGLIPKSVDARNATPTQKSSGKKLSTILDRFDDITSGKATTLKVPASQLKALRKAGFETTSGRVIVPHSATETAKLKRGQVSIESKSGMQRVVLPVEFHNLRQYLHDARENADVINTLKRKNEYFGIRLRGGQRANFYGNIQSLLDDLSKYDAIATPGSRPKQEELYRHLEILRLNRHGAREVEKRVQERKHKSGKSKKSPSKWSKRKHAEGERARRASMSKSELKHYRDAAKKRAAKSRRKKNGKRGKRK